MKLLLTNLLFILLITSLNAQNGVIVSGEMLNSPGYPIALTITLNSDPAVVSSLYTNPDGTFGPITISGSSNQYSLLTISFLNCDSLMNTTLYSVTQPLFMNVYAVLDFCDGQGEEVYGCMDIAAINYNPLATIDNGSCQYLENCDLNTVTFYLATQNWGSEIGWNLYLDSMVVAGGTGYSNFSTYSEVLCLEDGCYTLELLDSFGDGWNGGSYSIWYNGGMLVNGTLGSGNYSLTPFSLNSTDCADLQEIGCTDPAAINYNPIAIYNDGTCLYSSVENDLCADASELLPGIQTISNVGAFNNENIWGECWAFGSGEGEQTSIWFTFTTPDVPASIHIEALTDGTNSLTDTQFGLFETCGGEMIYCDGNSGQGLFSAFDFVCGQLQESTTYILMIDGYFGDIGTCLLSYEIDTTCAPVAGCTDVNAVNYNPMAMIDDGSCVYSDSCDYNMVQLILGGGVFPTEINWAILNSDSLVVANGDALGNNGVNFICLEDGCYTFEMFDSFGDGWNDGSFYLVMNGAVFVSGTLPSGQYGQIPFGINTNCSQINGCTDPLAINFNPDATDDDGSCLYPEPCDENEVYLVVTTGYWGEEVSWTITQDSTVLASGANYINNSSYTYQLCLSDGCYSFNLFDSYGDGWNGGSYMLMGANGAIISEGTMNFGFSAQYTFGINDPNCGNNSGVYGCTDPAASNFNPMATIDDGSCEYQFECYINFTVIPDTVGGNVIWIVPSSNINQASQVIWDFGDGSSSTDLFPSHVYAGDGPYTLCLTAYFEEPNGGYCSITYCAVLTYEMLNPPGMQFENGFTINVLNNSVVLSNSELEHGESINIWPNPASDQVFMSYSLQSNSNATIRILDVSGKLIQSFNHIGQVGTNNFNFNVQSLQAGMYFVEIISNDPIRTERLIVK